MHRIAARQPQTNRSILFDRTAEVFDIPNESVEVSAALEKALGLLIRTGRILKITMQSRILSKKYPNQLF